MDHNIFFNLYSFSNQYILVDYLIIFFADTLGYILIIFSLVYLFFYTKNLFDFKNLSLKYNFKDRVKKIIIFFTPVLFASGITAIIKEIVGKPRPFIEFENIKPLFLHGGMDSFPSGHSSFFLALAFSMFFINKKIGKIFFVLAFLIGLSRVIAGVHFPIDIIFGFFIGAFIPLIFRCFLKRANL